MRTLRKNEFSTENLTVEDILSIAEQNTKAAMADKDLKELLFHSFESLEALSDYMDNEYVMAMEYQKDKIKKDINDEVSFFIWKGIGGKLKFER